VPGDKGAALADDRWDDPDSQEHPGSFDPGLETGYLRRSPRDRELPLDDGAAPFDPGPGIGYDEKRAKRAAKRRGQEQRGPTEPRASAELALVETEPAAPDHHPLEELEREHERRTELDRARHRRELEERRERMEREREDRERLARVEREERERGLRERRERADREREELRRQELERRATVEQEREREAREQREARLREREERRDRWQRESEAITGDRERREERKRAERAAARRRRAERQLALSRGREPTPATGRPARSRPAKSRPRPVAERQSPKLRWATAKVGAALAVVTAAGTLLGAAIGLPVPVLNSDENLAASLGGAVGLDGSGTPIGLTRGPYFPVLLDAPADYAEGAAKFGANRGGRKHEGQDIFAKPGTPLVAVRDGIVIDGGGGKSFYSYGGGNSLVIYSALDDRSYVYLHMLKPAAVEAGETVHAGQLVGAVGCTGSCDGPHLHFEVRRGRVAYGADTKPLDPMPLLKQWPQASQGD
jgi:murein DD-endopeptidase MepM/ murein hydrolase activator NlpD